MSHVVILGNGIAGTTAAREIRKRDAAARITLVSSESDEFFSRTALMYVYMGHLTQAQIRPYESWFWEKNRLEHLRAHATGLDLGGKRLLLEGDRALAYDHLVVATGSKPNKFGWPGQDLAGVQGLYSLQDLELLERTSRGVSRAVIVGGGLIGVELAEMLLSRGIAVTFLVREAAWMDFAFPPAEAAMIERQIRRHGVDLRMATELERILPDGSGRARAVVTKAGEEIACELVGLTVGVSPNVSFLAGSGLEIDRGILVDPLLATSDPAVFAIGDCAQLREPPPGRRPIEPLWYSARSMGQAVARTIAGEPTRHDPGIYFNSAKFFDLEFQVYGAIKPRLAEGEATLYWEASCGDKSIRIDYRREDSRVLGFQVMGIRYRHELCDEWLREGRDLAFVLENLGAANFDPELYRQHEGELVALYNREHAGTPLRLERRRGLASLFALRRASSKVAP